MLNYLRWLKENWAYYKSIKNRKIPLWNNKLPSQTYFKYAATETFGGKKVLNVGCGLSVFKAPNVVNVDMAANDGINLVWDLSKTPLPLESNSFDFIIANHVLEHIPNWWNCFEELCRVLKPGGILEVWIPPISSNSAFSYRDHINRIGLESFVGVGQFRRGGTNLLASIELQEKSPSAEVELIWNSYRPLFVWWLLFTPQWFVEFAVTYLRNTVSEEGYRFQKRQELVCKK